MVVWVEVVMVMAVVVLWWSYSWLVAGTDGGIARFGLMNKLVQQGRPSTRARDYFAQNPGRKKVT